MRIGILGPLQLWDEAGGPVRLGGPRVRALLIRLAVDAGRTVPAGVLADDLWGADQAAVAPPADAAGALQALVARLRHAAGRDIVEFQPGGYRLAVDPGEVDAGAFEHLVAQGRAALAAGEPARGATVLERALDLWRGPALADVTDALFAAGPAARLEELRLAAAEERAEARLALGEGARLVPGLGELVAAHPLRERLRGQLMRALQAAGRQADALAVYEQARTILAEQLGADPSPELSAVHLAVLRQEPGPAPAAGASSPTPPGTGPRPGPPRRSGLPAQLTSFVGREAELENLTGLLAGSRLVTLTGPGGSGKTRLAVEALSRAAGRIPDGVWFVPLAPVREALDVPQAVLAAIGVPEATRMGDVAGLLVIPPADRLADAVADKHLILVLDNCEHLIDAVAALAGRLLAQAPGVRVLATSREPLGVTGETLCPVPSLPLPPPGATAAEAAAYPAVRLFADRAVAVRPGFSIDAGSAPPVIRICRALDGIPLAIELAAARLRSLTAVQVADRLGDRFALLANGSRAALPRHRALRALVDWSWDLLDADERAVLRRLSVFTGGASPDAALRVCAPVAAGREVIDLIASLVDKSLVMASGDGGDVRYRLLETVRAYAHERLVEAGEDGRVPAAHAACFLELAERTDPQLRGAGQVRGLEVLSAEHGNCTAALRHAIATGDTATALRLTAALTWFWLMRDHMVEAAQWAVATRDLASDRPPAGLTDALALCEFMAVIGTAAADGAQPDPGRLLAFARRAPVRPAAVDGAQPEPGPLGTAFPSATSLVPADTRYPVLALAAPLTALFSGDPAGARRAMADLAGHPDPWIRASQHAFAGHLALNEGDLPAAESGLTDGYAAFRVIGDRWGLVICLGGLAEVAMARGQPAEAVRLLEEARGYASGEAAGRWGDQLLIPLGRARAELGDATAGRAEVERGLRSAERAGEHNDHANGYVELGELARRDGDLPGARRLLERALEIIEARPRRPDMAAVAARTFSKLGCLAEQEGELDRAAHWHGRAMEVAVGTAAPFLPVNPSLGLIVEGFAALAAARGEHVRAAELLGLAHTLHGFCDDASLEVARASATATEALGEAGFAAAYARGAGLTREDALALVRQRARGPVRPAGSTSASPPGSSRPRSRPPRRG